MWGGGGGGDEGETAFARSVVSLIVCIEQCQPDEEVLNDEAYDIVHYEQIMVKGGCFVMLGTVDGQHLTFA